MMRNSKQVFCYVSDSSLDSLYNINFENEFVETNCRMIISYSDGNKDIIKEINNGFKFDYKFVEIIPEVEFFIFDNKEVVIFLDGQFEKMTAIKLSYKQIVNVYSEFFSLVWEKN